MDYHLPKVRELLVIVVLLLHAVYAVSTFAQVAPSLDSTEIQETIQSVGAIIHDEYFDVELAARVDDSLRQWLKQGRYAEADTRNSLAANLTKDLGELTHDKHLAVNVVRSNSGTSSSDESSDELRNAAGRRSNFGVQRMEVLSGNVGYLKLTAFYRLNEAQDVIASAMRTLRYADALILDLRDNGGGAPDTVALFAGYFLSRERLPLFQIVPRSGEKRIYETTTAELPGRNPDRPMYVLTSARTFSAGEGIAFLLQERRRTEVIGETTAGAANPGRPYRVNKHYEVTVPNGTVQTAINGKNWEGNGVIPDVKVSADDALRVAHIRAISRLLKQTNDAVWKVKLKGYIEELERSQR